MHYIYINTVSCLLIYSYSLKKYILLAQLLCLYWQDMGQRTEELDEDFERISWQWVWCILWEHQRTCSQGTAILAGTLLLSLSWRLIINTPTMGLYRRLGNFRRWPTATKIRRMTSMLNNNRRGDEVRMALLRYMKPVHCLPDHRQLLSFSHVTNSIWACLALCVAYAYRICNSIGLLSKLIFGAFNFQRV